MRAIGLLGGTFNPIHFGHLRMAQELAESLNLEEVRFIPSANPPHKPAPSVSAEHRSAMVLLGINKNPIFNFDNRELQRSGASYTIDTLHSLRDELGENVSLVLLLGSDAFSTFNTWHLWGEIIEFCHIALVQRTMKLENDNLTKNYLPKPLEIFLHKHYTEDCNDLRESSAGYVTMNAITPLDISSTAIRNALHNKRSARYLLPDNVIDYIQTHKLYDLM